MKIQKAEPLYQQVYRLVRGQILGGELRSGDSLQESHIAQALGVSRTPVREALRQLEHEGLAVGDAAARVVASPTEEELMDLYTCRMALERIVAERAALSADEEDVRVMSDAIEAALAAAEEEDHEGVLAANTRFHDRMVESARMAPLQAMMETIRAQILVARRHVLHDSADAAEDMCEEHAGILRTIRERDAARAVTLMDAHMRGDLARSAERFRRSHQEEPRGARGA